MKVVNKEGYAYYKGEPNDRERVTLIVTVITDMVPGAFYDVEDTMKVLARHPYVDTVELVES